MSCVLSCRSSVLNQLFCLGRRFTYDRNDLLADLFLLTDECCNRCSSLDRDSRQSCSLCLLNIIGFLMLQDSLCIRIAKSKCLLSVLRPRTRGEFTPPAVRRGGKRSGPRGSRDTKQSCLLKATRLSLMSSHVAYWSRSRTRHFMATP